MMHSHQMPVISPYGRKDEELGTVVAAHDQSVTAGMEMLDRGGNAVDAAVAAALVAGVIEPTETTLAGSGFLLFNDGESGQWSVEFGPRAPLAASSAMYDLDPNATSSNMLGLAPVLDQANINGPLASGVPRTLLGLLTAHERWGSLDRKTVCQPAVDAAYRGFPADTWFLTSALSDLERLRRDPQSRRTFLDENQLPLGSGSSGNYGISFDTQGTVEQPLLGQTLETVSEGDINELVDGSIARDMAKSADEMGALWGLADLKMSAPTIRRPLAVKFRDFDVSVPVSPGGGVTELQILNIWQAMYPDESPAEDSPERTRRLALAIRHAFADRYHWLGDPDVVPVPIDGLLNEKYASHLANLCLNDEDTPDTGEEPPWIAYASRAVHDPWQFNGDQTFAPVWKPRSASNPTSGTTHISAADASGRTVSITHTAANHFGSGIVCPRTGLMFDSSMTWFNAIPGAANSIQGGVRPLANMGPALITKNGSSVAALGASGGRRIISAVAQLIINMVDRGMSPIEALQAPRIEASGAQVLLHENRANEADAIRDLNPAIIPAGNQPYTMDFARANIAAYEGAKKTSSAIDANSFTY